MTRSTSSEPAPQRPHPGPDAPRWLGTFTPDDRAAIEALRAAQADAIVRGDAEAYAGLCTDDVISLLPGRDMAAGQQQFFELQSGFFRETKYASLRKTPVQVEVHDTLAVEVGRQQLVVASGPSGPFAAHQKYTHVFRKTPQGWRFAVLTSNSSL